MLYEIKWKQSPNFESRQGYKPIVIVNHITDGQDAVRSSDAQEESAVENTFMSPASGCSSHFDVLRDGKLKQFVDIQNDAWTQGLHGAADLALALSPIVRKMGVNPNLYSVSIEFEAYKDHGGDGSITEEQFWAGAWLHKWIQSEVQRVYGFKIALNSTYVIGHCHVDPVYRKFDPGARFPWARLYAELAIADNMSLADYEGRIKMLRSPQYQISKFFQIGNEVRYLYELSGKQDGEGEWARSVLLQIMKAFGASGVLPDKYSATQDYKQFQNDVTWLYDCARGTNGPEKVQDGIWALSTAYPYMLSNGLVPAA